MIHRVQTDDLLAEQSAHALRHRIGTDLAAWVLRPEARERLTIARPTVPDAPGSAVVLFAPPCEDECRRVPEGLAAGFGLPFQWRDDGDHSPHLPRRMRDVADQVCEALGIQGWGLHLGPALSDYDLSGVELGDCASAWAPLAASLLVRKEGGRPDPNVLATGRWTGQMIGRVDGLHEKFRAAADLCADPARRTIWVPAANWQDASDLVRDQASPVRVEAYPARISRTAREALRKHLAALDVRPARDAPVGDLLRWANADYVVADPPARRAYYLEYLAEKLGERLGRNYPDAAKVDRLVLTLGDVNVGLSVAVTHALRPRDGVWLLASKKAMSVCLVPYERAVRAVTPSVNCIELAADDPSDCARCAAELAAWLGGVPTGRLGVVEITGGTKEMTAVSVRAGQIARARILYLAHPMIKDVNQPRYGEERFIELDWLHDSR